MSENILENIKAGIYSRKELENLFSNAERLGRLDVLQAAKDALKQIDAKSYAKRFVKPIKDKVEEIAKDIARSQNWANWDDNKVGNGVKPGGPMLNGEELAEFYFSYRHPSWKRSSYLAVFQHDEESPVLYKVRGQNSKEKIVETSEEAIKLFGEAINAT